jgi:hypothetical protein
LVAAAILNGLLCGLDDKLMIAQVAVLAVAKASKIPVLHDSQSAQYERQCQFS